MMKKTIITFVCPVITCLLLLTWIACKKQQGDYDYTNPQVPFNGSTYDYLKSKPGIFDSLLLVINRLNLADTLKNNKVTLFAVTNQSFKLAYDAYNVSRIQNGRSIISLSNYDRSQLDSMMCRYIIRGIFPADSMALTSGLRMNTVRYPYIMAGKKTTANAEGQTQGGPTSITFSDTRRSNYTTQWKSTTANSINIKTGNGYVHVIDGSHIFGFDNYTKPVSLPYKGTPFAFPAVIGTSALLEAEDFDLGGQGVAYNDQDAKNNGGLYRPLDGVDIYSHPASVTNGVPYAAGFNIGSVVAGEWLNYSINVAVEGDYQIQVRYGNPANTGNYPSAFHLSVDWLNASGTIYAPVTSTSTSNFTTWAIIPVTLHLTAGRHYFEFNWEIAPIQMESFVITRTK